MLGVEQMQSRNQADVSTVSTTNEAVTGDNIGGADTMILDAGDMAYGLVGPYNLKTKQDNLSRTLF